MSLVNSKCPNAAECSGWDQYAADCEDGRVMPKCFVAIHRRIGLLDLWARESLGPDKLQQLNQRLRQAPEKQHR